MTVNMRTIVRPAGVRLPVLAIACIAIGALFAGCSRPTPPLPPLLRNVSAGGGWWGSCPPETSNAEVAYKDRTLAISPELDQRLSVSFPPGSNEKALVAELESQGFKLLSHCRGDTSIHAAAFNQRGGSLFAYPLTANVFWKVDDDGHILWTRGFVRYNGL